ncbi:uncharacterized protein CANTADRAFT_56152 [Suhomyces tanzawaensis NRRL Y-17324]|uniref:Uncharacterized protein n=1 Tax=Suhomyces tanzawaensis NRRL Y-17324 TaxID=984487 RepID=A0A1E4SCS6_9ASCO|nr:uncharacterized protein CANTADRAFT_56152 [Suhomyces tanzawaensis NRRL Y-17324]ODV77309.1 hypothetical protein CANTADRAFT_56152 [Suhomyces tanzawaensis NRRL Y-17324]
MCRPSTCSACQNTTWIGCGLHIPRAMDPVPRHQWCTCESISGTDIGDYPPKAGDGRQAAPAP